MIEEGTEPGAAQGGGPRRRALVTGASSGIGRAFAERLAQDQWDLLIVARSTGPLQELARTLEERRGVQVEVLARDLTDPKELRDLEERVLAATPELLVNNAGFGTSGPFAGLDPDREEAEIRLNVLALVRLTRAALPAMIERGHGSIINVSSLAGLAPMPFNAVYGATKAFVNAFSEGVAEEVRGTGVRFQVLLPGFTRTGFQDRAGVDASKLPAAAWMQPETVVEASLRGLARGQLVCVPGVGNQVLGGAQRLLPRALLSRLMGAVARRTNE